MIDTSDIYNRFSDNGYRSDYIDKTDKILLRQYSPTFRKHISDLRIQIYSYL